MKEEQAPVLFVQLIDLASRLTASFRNREIERTGLPAMEEHFRQLIEPLEEPTIVIDFSGVVFLPTTGLGTLVAINKWIRERNGQLCLANLVPQICEMLAISRLDQILQVFENSESALASFG